MGLANPGTSRIGNSWVSNKINNAVNRDGDTSQGATDYSNPDYSHMANARSVSAHRARAHTM